MTHHNRSVLERLGSSQIDKNPILYCEICLQLIPNTVINVSFEGTICTGVWSLCTLITHDTKYEELLYTGLSQCGVAVLLTYLVETGWSYDRLVSAHKVDRQGPSAWGNGPWAGSVTPRVSARVKTYSFAARCFFPPDLTHWPLKCFHTDLVWCDHRTYIWNRQVFNQVNPKTMIYFGM